MVVAIAHHDAWFHDCQLDCCLVVLQAWALGEKVPTWCSYYKRGFGLDIVYSNVSYSLYTMLLELRKSMPIRYSTDVITTLCVAPATVRYLDIDMVVPKRYTQWCYLYNSGRQSNTTTLANSANMPLTGVVLTMSPLIALRNQTVSVLSHLS